MRSLKTRMRSLETRMRSLETSMISLKTRMRSLETRMRNNAKKEYVYYIDFEIVSLEQGPRLFLKWSETIVFFLNL